MLLTCYHNRGKLFSVFWDKSRDKFTRKEAMKQAKNQFEMEARPRLKGTKRLCERLHVSRNTLWAVTRGLREPKPELARKLRRLGLLPAAKGSAE